MHRDGEDAVAEVGGDGAKPLSPFRDYTAECGLQMHGLGIIDHGRDACGLEGRLQRIALRGVAQPKGDGRRRAIQEMPSAIGLQ